MLQFMQRKKQAEVRKQNAVQERKKQDAWVIESPEDDKDGSDAIICVQDVPDPSLPLIFGRRSFGGFNKAVEVCSVCHLCCSCVLVCRQLLAYRTNLSY